MNFDKCRVGMRVRVSEEYTGGMSYTEDYLFKHNRIVTIIDTESGYVRTSANEGYVALNSGKYWHINPRYLSPVKQTVIIHSK